jgi:hypothetical protein
VEVLDINVEVSYVVAYGVLAHKYGEEIASHTWTQTQLHPDVDGQVKKSGSRSNLASLSNLSTLTNMSDSQSPLSEIQTGSPQSRKAYSPEDLIFFQVEWLCSAINDAERLCKPEMIYFDTALDRSSRRVQHPHAASSSGINKAHSQSEMSVTKEATYQFGGHTITASKRVLVALTETCAAFKHVLRKGADALCCALLKYITVCDPYMLQPLCLTVSEKELGTDAKTAKHSITTGSVRPGASVGAKARKNASSDTENTQPPWVSLFAHLQEFFRAVLGSSNSLAQTLNPVCLNTLLLSFSAKIVGWYLFQLNICVKQGITLTSTQLDHLDRDIANIRCVLVSAVNIEADTCLTEFAFLNTSIGTSSPNKIGNPLNGNSPSKVSPTDETTMRFSKVCSEIFGVLDVVCALLSCPNSNDASAMTHVMNIFKKHAVADNLSGVDEWCELCDWCLHLREDFPKQKRNTIGQLFSTMYTNSHASDYTPANGKAGPLYKMFNDAKQEIRAAATDRLGGAVPATARSRKFRPKAGKCPIRLALAVVHQEPTTANLESYLLEPVKFSVDSERHPDEYGLEAHKRKKGMHLLPTRWMASSATPNQGHNAGTSSAKEMIRSTVESPTLSRVLRSFSGATSGSGYEYMHIILSEVAMTRLPSMGAISNAFYFVAAINDVERTSSVKASINPTWPSSELEIVFEDLPANSSAINNCIITLYFRGGSVFGIYYSYVTAVNFRAARTATYQDWRHRSVSPQPQYRTYRKRGVSNRLQCVCEGCADRRRQNEDEWGTTKGQIEDEEVRR